MSKKCSVVQDFFASGHYQPACNE